MPRTLDNPRGRTRTSTPGIALRHHTLTLLGTSWPWRSLGYLITTPIVAGVWLLTCWPLLPFAGVPLGRVERWRLRWIDLGPTSSPHTAPVPAGPRHWIRHRLGEQATWAELLYGAVLIPFSLLGFIAMTIGVLFPAVLAGSSALLIALLALGVDPHAIDPTSSAINGNLAAQIGFLVLGMLLLAAGMYLVTLAAEGQRYLTRLLISAPAAELAEQVGELTKSRARITTAFDNERRRIERDLHDGAQQRLTSLVMTLGTLQYQHEHGDDIEPLIRQARSEAQRAVDELRNIVHGIYPSALSEHDLADALDDLAVRTEVAGLRTKASIDLSGEISTDTQVAIYFAVSELFTNVAKHANASSVLLIVQSTAEDTISVSVQDDGCGGAHADGSGLLGVIDRIETLGGRISITSPLGGPTLITMELPCVSS